jgi:hypothetical protein
MSQAATLAGAAPDSAVCWHSINWNKVHRAVRRLQARIVKAVREGKWHKVKALVYLLTHSFSGRAVFAERKVQRRAERKVQRLCTRYQMSRHADKDVSVVSAIFPLSILYCVFCLPASFHRHRALPATTRFSEPSGLSG